MRPFAIHYTPTRQFQGIPRCLCWLTNHVITEFIIAIVLQSCKIPTIEIGAVNSSSADSSSLDGSLDLVAALRADKRGRKAAVGKKRARDGSAAAGSAESSSSAAGADGHDGGGGSRPASSSASSSSSLASTWVQLTRVTVAVDSVRGCADVYPSSPILLSYDLVAVQPTSAEIMKTCAASGAVDIIDLDMSNGRLPFPINKADVDAVLNAGCVFEISYAPTIRDHTCRRHVIANAMSLLRLTRNRGVILTSGARAVLEQRSPSDAMAIAALCGMNHNQCKAALSATVADVISHAEGRHGRNGVFVHVIPAAAAAAVPAGASSSTGVASGSSNAPIRLGNQAVMMVAHGKEQNVGYSGGIATNTSGGNSGGGAASSNSASSSASPAASASGAVTRPWLACLGARGVAYSSQPGRQRWLVAAPPLPVAASTSSASSGSTAAGFASSKAAGALKASKT